MDLTSSATVAGAGSSLAASVALQRLPDLGVLVVVCWLLWCLGWLLYASWGERAGLQWFFAVLLGGSCRLVTLVFVLVCNTPIAKPCCQNKLPPITISLPSVTLR